MNNYVTREELVALVQRMQAELDALEQRIAQVKSRSKGRIRKPGVRG